MAIYFDISKSSGTGDSTFTITPKASFVGRGPVSNTVTVKTSSNETATVQCSKVNAVSANNVVITGGSSLNSITTALTPSSGILSLPNTAYYVQFALNSNMKSIVLNALPAEVYLAVGSQWMQTDGSLGSTRANIRNNFTAGGEGQYKIIVPDPGVTNVFAAKVIVKYNANNTGAAIDNALKIYAGGTNYPTTSTDKAVIFEGVARQAAGVKTYANPAVTLSYPKAKANGDDISPTVSWTQTWGWNGATSGGGTESGNKATNYQGTGVTVNATTGVVVIDNLNTTAKPETTLGTVTASVIANGKTGTATATIVQEENKIKNYTYGDWVVTISANPTTIAGTGGTSTITSGASRSKTAVYTSGGTASVSPETATPTLSIPTGSTGFTLSGTTLTAAANPKITSRSVVVTATANGKTNTVTVTQNGGNSTLEVSPTSLTWSATESGAKTISITSNDSWTITIA